MTTLDLGPKLPQVLNASLPWQDELGLWVNLEVEYNSICQATVETKGIRLPGKDEPDREAQELARLLTRTAHEDSDEEDSAEEDDEVPVGEASDEDGDSPDLQPHAGNNFRKRGARLKRFQLLKCVLQQSRKDIGHEHIFDEGKSGAFLSSSWL